MGNMEAVQTGADLVDMMEMKKFLGQEFVTWLWFKSERDGVFTLAEFGDVQVDFQPQMRLEYGQGESLEEVTCKGGATHEFREARAGLLKGKKIERAKVSVSAGDYEYQFAVKAGLLELSGIKLPKTAPESPDETEAMQGLILDKMGMLERMQQIVDDLLEKFLKIRLDRKVWAAEADEIRVWIRQAAA